MRPSEVDLEGVAGEVDDALRDLEARGLLLGFFEDRRAVVGPDLGAGMGARHVEAVGAAATAYVEDAEALSSARPVAEDAEERLGGGAGKHEARRGLQDPLVGVRVVFEVIVDVAAGAHAFGEPPQARPQPIAGEDAPHAANVARSAADEVRLRRRCEPVLSILDDQRVEGGEALEKEARGPRVDPRGGGDGLGVGGAFGHVIEDAELESGAQDGAPQEAERHGDIVVGALRLGEERALKLVAGLVRFRRRHGIQTMRAPRVPQDGGSGGV